MVCYGSVWDRVRSDCRQMMNLFGGQGLEEQEGFDSGVCVCVCGFVSQSSEIEKLKEQGLWKEELEPTDFENQVVNSRSKKRPVREE